MDCNPYAKTYDSYRSVYRYFLPDPEFDTCPGIGTIAAIARSVDINL
jgi:hypothetical protein